MIIVVVIKPAYCFMSVDINMLYCSTFCIVVSGKAVNESLSFLQQQRTTVDIDTPDTDQTLQLEGDAYFDGDETEQMLQQAVASLPDKQRVVFIMKYFQEMKYEEMSDILQTSVGALKASYHIAAQKIEEYFHEHD